MDVREGLLTTLDRTLEIAEGLEDVSCMLRLSKGKQVAGRKQLSQLRKQVRTLSQCMRRPTMLTFEETPKARAPVRRQSDVVFDSPAVKTKRALSQSLKQTEQRVKLSRAGKRSVADTLAEEEPPMFATMKSLRGYFEEVRLSQKTLEQKTSATPFVSLTTGKVEEPLQLPSFKVFLESVGGDYFIRSAREEILYRIDRASARLTSFMNEFDQRVQKYERHFARRRISTKHRRPVVSSVDPCMDILGKTAQVREQMRQIYKSPGVYSGRPRRNSTGQSAEEQLEESLRAFYHTKTVENQKLVGMLARINRNRPMNLRKKVNLIGADHEKYKNKLHSLAKFQSFKDNVEEDLRAEQYKNYKQGLAYVSVLDTFKETKHEPSEAELVLLEVWRQLVQNSWVVTPAHFTKVLQLFSKQEQTAVSELATLLSKSL